jgi:hypothetical protein
MPLDPWGWSMMTKHLRLKVILSVVILFVVGFIGPSTGGVVMITGLAFAGEVVQRPLTIDEVKLAEQIMRDSGYNVNIIKGNMTYTPEGIKRGDLSMVIMCHDLGTGHNEVYAIKILGKKLTAIEKPDQVFGKVNQKEEKVLNIQKTILNKKIIIIKELVSVLKQCYEFKISGNIVKVRQLLIKVDDIESKLDSLENEYLDLERKTEKYYGGRWPLKLSEKWTGELNNYNNRSAILYNEAKKLEEFITK